MHYRTNNIVLKVCLKSPKLTGFPLVLKFLKNYLLAFNRNWYQVH